MAFNELFKTKDINALLKIPVATEGNPGLKKTLTRFNLVSLGIGAIIGTGIFVLTGTAAANQAGPALVLSFIISALGCGFAGLCYAEFCTMIPTSGSAYTYAYATLGEFVAWIIGWDLILEYLFASSTVAVGWSGYMVSFLYSLGIPIPEQFSKAPLAFDEAGWHTTGAVFNLPAVFIVVLVSSILVLGIKESARFNNVIVYIKIAVILLFIIFGMGFVDTSNWTPFIPEEQGLGKFGWSGILAGAGVIFFAYIGFDAVSTAAQEAKNPQKDMPFGILGSLIVCTILYIVVSLILTGIVNYKDLNVPAPIALAIDRTGSSLAWLSPLIKIGAIAGLSSVILVMLMGQPRIFMAMSNDGLLPPVFGKIHPKYQTPYISTIITGSVAALVAAILPINILGELVSIGTLLAFVIVCGGIMVLRKTRPDLPRPFKTPWMPFVPIMGILICFAQMVLLPPDTWIRLFTWMAIGIVVYFAYGRKRSKLNAK
jgi:APA family basic amino acid/polyamine antiporter